MILPSSSKEQIATPMVIRRIEDFSKASGLYLNLKKCKLISIHDHPLTELYGIPVKSQVKYLGVVISKDYEVREELNFAPGIKKVESILSSRLQRDLSIFGWILSTKIETLSRVMFPTFSLANPDYLIKSIDQKNFDFVWKKTPSLFEKRGCGKIDKCDWLWSNEWNDKVKVVTNFFTKLWGSLVLSPI